MPTPCTGISGELQPESLPSRTSSPHPAPNDQPLLLHRRNCPDVLRRGPGSCAQWCHKAGWRTSTGQLRSIFSALYVFIQYYFYRVVLLDCFGCCYVHSCGHWGCLKDLGFFQSLEGSQGLEDTTWWHLKRKYCEVHKKSILKICEFRLPKPVWALFVVLGTELVWVSKLQIVVLPLNTSAFCTSHFDIGQVTVPRLVLCSVPVFQIPGDGKQAKWYMFSI